MNTPRFYTPQPLSNNMQITFAGERYNYLANVLRLKVGAQLTLFNGLGGEYLACIEQLSRKSAQIFITEHIAIERESPVSIVLCQGVAKGEKMEWIIRKATELGVSAIIPVITERTQFAPKGERVDKKQAHWERIVISACEQCGRNRLPPLLPAQSMTDILASQLAPIKELAIANNKAAIYALFLDPTAAQGLPTPTSIHSSTQDPLSPLWVLWIGPEGGFSAREMELAKGLPNTLLCQMGPRVLRTETAGIAAISILQHQFGDMAARA